MRGAWEEPPTLAEAAALPESGAWSTEAGWGSAPGSALAGHLELIPAPFGAPGPTAAWDLNPGPEPALTPKGTPIPLFPGLW